MAEAWPTWLAICSTRLGFKCLCLLHGLSAIISTWPVPPSLLLQPLYQTTIDDHLKPKVYLASGSTTFIEQALYLLPRDAKFVCTLDLGCHPSASLMERGTWLSLHHADFGR
jgi:hypothetical protein